MQELLLHASIGSGPEVLEAWAEWKHKADIDAVDLGSHRILPLLYRNLLDHGVSDPLLARLKSTYRYYWYQNAVLLHRGEEVLSSFRQAGIPTMVLKGAALVALYYHDAALRPMQDFDIAVPFTSARKAITLLQRSGWRPQTKYDPRHLFLIRHSTPFIDCKSRQIDLHWHVLGTGFNISCDTNFWKRSIPLNVGGVATRTLGPTDQLVHVCSHGAEWSEVPPLRWVADALSILKSSSTTVDWQLLLETVEFHHLQLPLLNALIYLKKNFGAPLPDDVLNNLQRLPVGPVERYAYETAIRPLSAPTNRQLLQSFVFAYAILSSSIHHWQRPWMFVRYLQHRFQLTKASHLLLVLPWRALRRLWSSRSR